MCFFRDGCLAKNKNKMELDTTVNPVRLLKSHVSVVLMKQLRYYYCCRMQHRLN